MLSVECWMVALCAMLNVECWMFECWVLSVECWVLSVEWSPLAMLNVWMLNVECWMLNGRLWRCWMIDCWMIDCWITSLFIPHSSSAPPTIQHSTFHIRHCACAIIQHSTFHIRHFFPVQEKKFSCRESYFLFLFYDCKVTKCWPLLQ